MMSAQRGSVVVMMLAVVVLLSLAIGASLTWVETGISSVRHAEATFVIEESMIAAIRVASVDMAGESGCGEWAGRTYLINEREVGVTCEAIDGRVYLRAELGVRWLRAEVEQGAVAGDRWRLMRWTWPDQTQPG